MEKYLGCIQSLPLTEVLSCFYSHDFLRIGIFILGVRLKLKQSKKGLIFRALKLYTNAARNGVVQTSWVLSSGFLGCSSFSPYITHYSSKTFIFFELHSPIILMKCPFPVHRELCGSPQSSLSHPASATPPRRRAAPRCSLNASPSVPCVLMATGCSGWLAYLCLSSATLQLHFQAYSAVNWFPTGCE